MTYRKITDRTPSADGYYMPGEYERHRGTLLVWPVRPGSWPYGGRDAKPVFARIAQELSREEEVWILADAEHTEEVRTYLENGVALQQTCVMETDESADLPRTHIDHIHIVNIPTDDAWARDIGPTFLKKRETDGAAAGTTGGRAENAAECAAGVSWRFNAWGGEADGLYAEWAQDDLAAERFLAALDRPCYDAGSFVLEGGSVHCDGEGTVLTTEECLLSKGRNPQLTREEIEQKLRQYLGAKKVIWLPYGIYNDETNGHVDNICCFVKPGEVLLAWTDDENDPQYARSAADLAVLENTRDAAGRKLVVHKMPQPAVPVTVSEDDLKGYVFEPGEDVRDAGERLAASYVNFYIANGLVLVPQFGGENVASDREAVRLLESLFPERRVVPVEAGAIIAGGGNIHCITQQVY